MMKELERLVQTKQFIIRYADNAWVYLRFGLQQYFKDNHIAVPSYTLNEEGLMVDANNRLLRLV